MTTETNLMPVIECECCGAACDADVIEYDLCPACLEHGRQMDVVAEAEAAHADAKRELEAARKRVNETRRQLVAARERLAEIERGV